MRKDCGDAAETVQNDYGSSADIVRTQCGTWAVPLRTRRRSALLGHHTNLLPRARGRETQSGCSAVGVGRGAGLPSGPWEELSCCLLRPLQGRGCVLPLKGRSWDRPRSTLPT